HTTLFRSRHGGLVIPRDSETLRPAAPGFAASRLGRGSPSPRPPSREALWRDLDEARRAESGRSRPPRAVERTICDAWARLRTSLREKRLIIAASTSNSRLT